MSGGAFDYKQYNIEDVARQIEEVVIKNNLPIPKECLEWYEREYYNEDNPPLYSEYSKEVIDKMKEGVKYLFLSAIYTHRIDYLISGDDGEEAFLRRLEKEINDFNNSFKL